jgi:hypothetical protein
MGRFPFNNAEDSDIYFKMIKNEELDEFRKLMDDYSVNRHNMCLTAAF